METFTEDKNHANPEPTQPLHTQPAHHTHTTQRSNAAGAARKGPCPRSQKRFVLLGKHIAREAGDGLGSSMGPFPYHLVHISLGHPSLYPALPICLPSPLLIHLVHLNRSDRLLRSRHFPLLGSSSKVQPAPCVAASFAPLPQPPARCTQPALILRRGPTFPWLCYSTTEW